MDLGSSRQGADRSQRSQPDAADMISRQSDSPREFKVICSLPDSLVQEEFNNNGIQVPASPVHLLARLIILYISCIVT